MDAHKLQVKIFADTTGRLALESFIPIFHRWIKSHVLEDTLVDVANYAHVHRGPGVALIGHRGDYFMEEGDGRPGLLYSSKREPPPPAERLADAFRRALHAAELLEKEPGANGLRFRTDEFLFRINDRLAAPNTDATFASVRPELDVVSAKLFGAGAYELASVGTPKQLFSIRITTRAGLGLPDLLAHIGK